MPSSKPASPGARMWRRPCDGREVHGAAGEPRTAQLRRAPRCAPAGSRRRSDSRTSCRTRRRRSRAVTARRSSRLVGHERRRVEQHVPARRRAPRRRARADASRRRNSTAPGNANRLSRGRIALRRAARAAARDRSAAPASSAARRRPRALRARELADAVHRVVVVDGEQAAPAAARTDTTRRRA